MWRILIAALLCLASVTAYAAGDSLPSGYLAVSGNQIIGGSGQTVRLACIGYNKPTSNFNSDMSIIRNLGFNCARVPWYDATLNLTTMDQIVTAATANNIRIIFDHHGNEANNTCLEQQSNGLWYDKNGSTQNNSNGTDGCGVTGTITYAAFKTNWISIATHYANNTTVIGMDLHNEGLVSTGKTVANMSWGASTEPGIDMQAMCQDVGTAIHGTNAGVLIICEGLVNNTATLANGNPNPIVGLMDLSGVTAHPVTIANKVVYSVHESPNSISGITPDSGTTHIAAMNTDWGYLVTNGTAPVWIGKMGASLDNTNGALAAEQAWADTITNYANGLSGGSGGPVFGGTQQPISTDWWTFGNLTGQPDGIIDANNVPRPGQQTYWTTLLYHAAAVPNTTWNPADASGMTLSGSNLVATSATVASNYITPGSGSFTDASSNVYSLDSSGNAIENGTAIPGGAGTSAMELFGGQIYAQDAVTGAWFIFNGTVFTAASAPPIPNAGTGVRTTTGRSTGKFCIAVTETTVTSNISVAVSSLSTSLTARPGGAGVSSVGFFGNSSGQQIFVNGAAVASNPSLAALTNGEIVKVVIDATNALVWFSTPEMVAAGTAWNHSASANPTNGTGGIPISSISPPYFLEASAQEGGSVSTLNATPSGCPAGVSTWDTVVANIGRPITVILGANNVGRSLLLPTPVSFTLNH
jgi:endoglucanase